MVREELLSRLQSLIQVNGHILGVAAGNGMTAEYAKEGGADLILALSAGRFRQMGQSAFSGFFGCENSNRLVMEYGTKEIMPVAQTFPIIFGLFVQDPCIHLYEYLHQIQEEGFSGVINYPSVGFFEGKFRNALEISGMGYEKEIEAIRLAHFLGLFTIAYVFDSKQAVQMAKAGADVICVHFGITGGGKLGSSQVLPLELALQRAEKVFEEVEQCRSGIIKMVCGGPVQTPIDTQSFYQNTKCQGFIGGSSIERLPVERAMLNTIRAFKSQGDFDSENIIAGVLNGTREEPDYGEFMVEYIKKNYGRQVRLKDLAVVTHMSVTRLSVLFKEKTGKTFTEYLIDCRMKKAADYIANTSKQMKEISALVGYDDYTQFSKMFKKEMGCSPAEYRLAREKGGNA